MSAWIQSSWWHQGAAVSEFTSDAQSASEFCVPGHLVCSSVYCENTSKSKQHKQYDATI